MKDNKKTNKTRRQRGYAFENGIVKDFKSSGWVAKRLGSPSVNLPDVMCIHNVYKTIIAIEAKSTVSNYAYVPQDQVERCIDWVNTFGVYDKKIVVLAFKFGRINGRELRIFYKVFPHKKFKPSDVRVDYNGNTMMKHDGEWMSKYMEMLKIE